MTHTGNASTNLYIAEAMLICGQDSLSLRATLVTDHVQEHRPHTSTKLAQFPSSSTPRVLNRVPARFHPRREIRHTVATVGVPSVGGAGSARVKTPTYP